LRKLIEITLGIMTAVGGFVDISEVVFASQAGSRFAYALIWVFVLATIGIATFGEMSGRVAAVAKLPVFSLMRQRLGLQVGFAALVASLAVTLITCAAEIGGMGLILNLLTGLPLWSMAIASTLLLVVVVWALPFKWIERTFGLLGLLMLAFAAATLALSPPWGAVAGGLVPQVPAGLSLRDQLVFGYFGVAIISAVLFPYETYFYSSGGIEEQWKPSDLGINRLTTIVGFGLGSLLAICLLVNSAVLFAPLHIDPQMPGSVAMQTSMTFGSRGLLLGLAGMLFAIAGAAVETCLSCAYSLSQFLGWEWGRYRKPWEAPRFTLAWLATFALALIIVLTGIKPLDLVEWSVVASIVVLPLSYFPLLAAAGDRVIMGQHVNGPVSNSLGWAFFIILCVAALAAAPLYFLTHGGQT
jgi:manganese transport protein